MNLGDITLNHIRILKAVDSARSFSQAAKDLGYSQALVSKKIKQLEDFFGTCLITRTPGASCLTNNGKRLISKTIHLCEDLEILKLEINKPIDSLGTEVVVGITPFLSSSWLKKYFKRFSMCFPNKEIVIIETTNRSYFSSKNSKKIDLAVNNFSAYKEDHPCNRLQTYRLIFIDLNSSKSDSFHYPVSINDIDFSKLLILNEIQHELLRGVNLNPELINLSTSFDQYDELIKALTSDRATTILPEFCLEDIPNITKENWAHVHDISEFGVYIHVPPLSELLVLAEGLVRSFRLEQNDEKSYGKNHLPLANSYTKKTESLRIGIQRDSIGQLISSYGVKYINSTLKNTKSNSERLKDLNIYRDFDIQIKVYSSGELMNRQMGKGELDICIMDEMSLLNNGSSFFDGLNFHSKLIAIASYNILGEDIRIVIPKKSNISSIKDLAGKRISTVLGSSSHRYLITLLDVYGIDANSQCFLIDEDPRTASNSLSNGNIDAHVCCETYAALLEDHNYSKKLHQDDSDAIKIPSLRGIVCRSQFTRENPEFVISYLHDLIIANHWFLQNQINGIQQLSQLTSINSGQTLSFFSSSFGTRIDPTLKPQWSWFLKTLNRRLEGNYGINKFDVDFWMDDYFLRLIYNSLGIDYHFQQIGFSSKFSHTYFTDEKFGGFMNILNSNQGGQSFVALE